ncbi:MAG: sulfotransferase [Pseudomonadaceae bacterium]|nr:sulfotransferase [Pseudomonadaceae bacterium]
MKPELLYILSPSFSGSTLLTLMLGQHPQIATIGELKATSMGPIEDYHCSCGELINACSFWQTLIQRSEGAGEPLDFDNFGTQFASSNSLFNRVLGAQVRGPAFELVRRLTLGLVPGLRQNYQSILQRNEFLVRQTLELQSGSLFLDGSKDPNRLLYFIDSDLFDLRVIYMHRDGRAQSNSRRQKKRWPVDYAGAAAEWAKTIDQMDRVASRLPADRIQRVVYEELCADPNAVLEGLWPFIGIEALDQDWRDVDLRKRPHHILGNPMRTRDSIKIKLDERWRSDVTTEEAQRFEQLAGETNRRLGYASGEPYVAESDTMAGCHD